MNKKIFYKVEMEINEQAKSYLLSLYVDDEEHTTFSAAEVIENSIFTDACVLITRTMYDMLISQARAAQLLHAPVGSVEGNLNAKDVENDRPKACRADHDEQIKMLDANFCHECGERLFS